jgi:hypothetical protein
MPFSMKLVKTLCILAAGAAIMPGAAFAHDGTNDGRTDGNHFGHHHRGVVLKGNVQSVDSSNGTLVVKVDKATRGGDALEGDTVTVKAVKGWVADTNNDGKRSVADVQTGDTVLVFTKRRFVDADANTVSAAFVIDKTHPKTFDRAAFNRAYEDGARDGTCDHRS